MKTTTRKLVNPEFSVQIKAILGSIEDRNLSYQNFGISIQYTEQPKIHQTIKLSHFYHTKPTKLKPSLITDDMMTSISL